MFEEEKQEETKGESKYDSFSPPNFSSFGSESKVSNAEDDVVLEGAYRKRIAYEFDEKKDDDDDDKDPVNTQCTEYNKYIDEKNASPDLEQDVGRTFHYFYPKVLRNFLNKPTKDEDPNLPQYLLNHYKGNYKKAKRRYDLIQSWRETLNIDDRLNYKPKFFDLCEDYLHTIFVGRAKKGEVVFCESYQKLDLDRFEELGVTPQHFNDFLIFIHEYMRVHINQDIDKKEPNHCFVVIDASTMDLKGALKKEVYRYTEINMETMENFYPTHIKKVFLVNPSNVLRHIWKAFKLVLPKSLSLKFNIVSSADILEEHIDLNIIPPKFGGQKTNEEVTNNEMYREFRRFIDDLPSEEEYMASK